LGKDARSVPDQDLLQRGRRVPGGDALHGGRVTAEELEKIRARMPTPKIFG
jgi:hypothetical protein